MVSSIAVFATVILGLGTLIGILVFTWARLPMNIDIPVCRRDATTLNQCQEIADCDKLLVLKESFVDFFLRRNEFWQITGQVTVVALVVTLLTLLLLFEKVDRGTALTLIGSVLSFVLGKGIAGATSKKVELPKDSKPGKE